MKGQITLERIRPDGYEYPVGLNTGGGALSVDYLVVAGGGGAGYDQAGGGGAGGYQAGSGFSVTPGTPYSITVGAGGASASNDTSRGSNGSSSIFSSFLVTFLLRKSSSSFAIISSSSLLNLTFLPS